jgi:hypothetical protein
MQFCEWLQNTLPMTSFYGIVCGHTRARTKRVRGIRVPSTSTVTTSGHRRTSCYSRMRESSPLQRQSLGQHRQGHSRGLLSASWHADCSKTLQSSDNRSNGIPNFLTFSSTPSNPPNFRSPHSPASFEFGIHDSSGYFIIAHFWRCPAHRNLAAGTGLGCSLFSHLFFPTLGPILYVRFFFQKYKVVVSRSC